MDTIRMILLIPLILANAAVLTSNLDEKVVIAWIFGWVLLMCYLYG